MEIMKAEVGGTGEGEGVNRRQRESSRALTVHHSPPSVLQTV